MTIDLIIISKKNAQFMILSIKSIIIIYILIDGLFYRAFSFKYVPNTKINEENIINIIIA